MRVLLLSTYELGHQPLLLAGPAGALRHAGHDVRVQDLAVDAFDVGAVDWAQAVALAVPMHTAARLARTAAEQVRHHHPDMPVCFYGLYAGLAGDSTPPLPGTRPMPDLAIAGELEPELVRWVDGLAHRTAPAGGPTRTVVTVRRGVGATPDRSGLPPLSSYARLVLSGEERLAGYVEASRGCAHRCRHCPVPVVYDGRTRLVGVDAVVADVAGLVDLGARHVTFGDPDFLNGPHHARRVVEAVHGSFPELTFDATVKVEHILRHRDIWHTMASSGCLFVVSAFESASDHILAVLDKGHSVADAVEAVGILRAAGIEPRPSLLPFTPWTGPADLAALVDLVAACDLAGNVDAVQYAIRLLVPPGSLLLASGHLSGLIDRYDASMLTWRWRSPDPALDALQLEVAALAESAASEGWGALDVYRRMRRAVAAVVPGGLDLPPEPARRLRSAWPVDERPRLTEAWFCCAEPTGAQLRGASAASTISTTQP